MRVPGRIIFDVSARRTQDGVVIRPGHPILSCGSIFIPLILRYFAMKDVTIADVANRADVSKSAGSAVLNDRDVVEDSTWKRILNAIEALNYRPSGLSTRRL